MIEISAYAFCAGPEQARHSWAEFRLEGEKGNKVLRCDCGREVPVQVEDFAAPVKKLIEQAFPGRVVELVEHDLEAPFLFFRADGLCSDGHDLVKMVFVRAYRRQVKTWTAAERLCVPEAELAFGSLLASLRCPHCGRMAEINLDDIRRGVELLSDKLGGRVTVEFNYRQ
jgi:hypothetical protein